MELKVSVTLWSGYNSTLSRVIKNYLLWKTIFSSCVTLSLERMEDLSKKEYFYHSIHWRIVSATLGLLLAVWALVHNNLVVIVACCTVFQIVGHSRQEEGRVEAQLQMVILCMPFGFRFLPYISVQYPRDTPNLMFSCRPLKHKLLKKLGAFFSVSSSVWIALEVLSILLLLLRTFAFRLKLINRLFALTKGQACTCLLTPAHGNMGSYK